MTEAPPARNALGRNVLWTYGDVVVGIVTQLVQIGYAARTLGRPGYGVFALVVSLVLVLTALQFCFSLTVQGAASRIVTGTEQPGDRGNIIASHAALAGCGWFAFLAGDIAALVLSIGKPDVPGGAKDVAWLVLLMTASGGLGFLCATAAGVVRGATQYRTASLASSGGRLVTLIIVLALLKPWGIAALGVAQLAGQLVTNVILVRKARAIAPWLSVIPQRVSRPALRRVGAIAAPLLVVSIGQQVVAATDLVAISAIIGAATTALYQLGSTLPNRALLALFQGYDVVFPYLAGGSSAARQEHDARTVSRLFSYLGGLGFGLLIVFRTPLNEALAGNHVHSGLSDTVLVLFSLTCMVNTGVHGIALLSISRHLQSATAKFFVIEASLNIVLTIVGVYTIGSSGAAWATLIAISLSNVIALPLLLRGKLGSIPFTFPITDGLFPSGLGFGIAFGLGLLISQGVAGLGGFGLSVPAVLLVGAALAYVGLGQRRQTFVRVLLHPPPD